MTNPAFIVEGFLEKQFIRDACPGRPIRRLELNGTNVALEAIVDRIETLVRLFGNRHNPIIILFDREGRVETSTQIATTVLQLLSARNVPGTFVVGVPDRMIENWILADEGTIARLKAPQHLKASSYDGHHGKAVLKQLLASKHYRETIDGVQMLKNALASSIARRSASFRAFHSQLQLNCYWTMR
jgi:hypothetical protein